MNYVESFNLLGVEAKQIPCIRGEGVPTTSTEGAVGCFYMDTTSGTLYKCTAIEDGNYIWDTFEGEKGEPGNDGSNGTNGVTFTPHVSADGTLSWTNDGNLVNPEPVNIVGNVESIGEIVQTTGDSTTAVMSQKASSKAFANAPKATVSGNILRIEDISPITHPMSVKVRGVADPTSVKVCRSGINALPYPFYDTTKTINGITFTDNGDGTVTANGTATAQATFTAAFRKIYSLPATKVHISGCPAGGGASTYQVSFGVYNGDTFVSSIIDYGSGIDFNLKNKVYTNCTVYCIVNKGATVTNLVFKPMVEIASQSGEFTQFVGYDIFTPNADGSVDGVGSISSPMIIMVDDENVTLDVEYNKDISRAFARAKGNDLVKLTKIGNAIQIKSAMGENDIAIRADLFGQHNKSFNFSGYYLVSPDADDKDITSGTLFKTAFDDITPIYFHNSYRGGNHGDSNVRLLTFTTAHGLSVANIGEVWQDASASEFIILQVPSNTTIMVGKYDASTLLFASANPTAPLTKGANSLTWNTSEASQLRPSVNHITVKIFDEEGGEITSDGVYGGKYFDVSVSYDIPTVQATVEYLKSNVGNNTNLSCASDEIESKYCTVNNIYRFTERGAITEYQAVDWNCSTYISAGFIQSAKAGDYYCIPLTSKSGITLQGSEGINVDNSIWDDAECPPDRFYQFTKQNAEMGFCIGYNSEYGNAIPTARKSLSRAGRYETTGKIYPYLKVGNVAENSVISAICYRTPISRYDDDITAVSWYYIGDDIYLLLDVHKTVNKYINLPSYMNGRKVTLVKTSGSISVQSPFTTAQGVKIIVDTYGSAIIKLTK